MAIRQNFPGTNEMTFFNVITRGLKRRPIRTGLTLLGIAVGIAAVVALIGLVPRPGSKLDRRYEVTWYRNRCS